MTPMCCLAGGGNLKPSWELLFQVGDLTPARGTRLADLQESESKIKSFLFFFFLDLLVGLSYLCPHGKSTV